MSSVKVAGRGSKLDPLGVAGCFHQPDPPPTPEHLKHHRKSLDVGRSVHLHSKDKQSPEKRYGRPPDVTSLHVGDLLSQKDSLVDQKLFAEQEKLYRSTALEPLGKSAKSPTTLPESMKTDFRFGVTSKQSAHVPDSLVCPPDDTTRVDKRAAGYQTQRNYDWAKPMINPAEHRFGSVPSPQNDNTSRNIELTASPTKLISKELSDHKTMTADDLGVTRVLSTTNSPQRDHGFTYGRKSVSDEWNARKCLTSSPVKSPGSTLSSPAGTPARHRLDKSAVSESHVFGVPSVRSDKPIPSTTKITSNVNYGQDVGAGALLYPGLAVAKGVTERDFSARMSLDEVRDICAKAKLDLSAAEIDAAYAHADAKSGGTVSLEAFRRAVDALGY